MGLERVAALELLKDLLEAGFQVEADRQEYQVVVIPGSRLTHDLRERIRRWKAALVKVLDPAPPEGPCPECGGISFVRPALGTWDCLSCTELTRPEQARWYFGPLKWAEED